MRTTVLVSGTGSNLSALLRASQTGRCAAPVTAVISDKPAARALSVAQEHGVETAVVQPRAYPSRSDWNGALCAQIEATKPDLVVLAGFMRIVADPVVSRFAHRMINVHPSLLPSFPGRDGPKQAIEAGVRVSGCTVHLVDAGVDSGAILAQGAVAVHPQDDVDALHRRIQSVEHRILPAVVDAIARGTLTLGPPPRWQGPGPDGEEAALVVPSAADLDR